MESGGDNHRWKEVAKAKAKDNLRGAYLHVVYNCEGKMCSASGSRKDREWKGLKF